MKIYNYNSYEEYVNAQIEGNTRKIKNSYVDPISLGGLVGHLYEQYSLKPSTILCHGTRRGLEQQYFLDVYKDDLTEVAKTDLHKAIDTFEERKYELKNAIKEEDRRKRPMVHLHLHTFHSILDGCGSVDNYVKHLR
jgi:hypothetical protein